MAIEIIDILKNNPQLLAFILLAFGFWVGKFKLGSFAIGAPAGILIVGTVFGYFGFELPPLLGAFSFLVFLFAVAYEAGPGFFAVALPQFKKFMTLTLVVVAIEFILTVFASMIFGFNFGLGTGLFTGSGVSAPGLGAAIDIVKTGKISLPDDLSVDQMVQLINISYVITFLTSYLIGMQLIRQSPRLLRFDLAMTAQEAELAMNMSDDESDEEGFWTQTFRAYRVETDEVVGKSIEDFEIDTNCKIDKIKRADIIIDFEPSTMLKKDDLISVGGHRLAQAPLNNIVGSEIVDRDLLGEEVLTRDVIVTNPSVMGKSLKELERYGYGCHLGKYTRSGVSLKVYPELRLMKGDILKITGNKTHLDQIIDLLGYAERDINATDLFTFALGISAGFILGLINISIGNISIGLGTASGVLVAGLVIGYVRSIKQSFGQVPPAVIWVFKQLGLLIFLADVGVKGGPSVVTALTSFGPLLILLSILIGTLPLVIGYLVGDRFFKMNRALLIGAIAGCGNNTPAMLMLVEDAKSSIPAVGYAGTYAITYIVKVIATTIIIYIL